MLNYLAITVLSYKSKKFKCFNDSNTEKIAMSRTKNYCQIIETMGRNKCYSDLSLYKYSIFYGMGRF